MKMSNSSWGDAKIREMLTGIEGEEQVSGKDLAILEDRVEVPVGLDREMFANNWELVRVSEVDNGGVGRHG